MLELAGVGSMKKRKNKKKMKVKRIKLYDGYITINQEPKKWAFDSNILHLRKNVSKRS